MNYKTRYLVFATLTFFVVELIARMFDFYSKYIYYDDLSHLLFGISFYSLFKLISKLRLTEISFLYLIIALLWEVLEKIGDTLFEQPTYLLDFFYFDGVFDVLFGYIGILIANYIYVRKFKK